jgi:DNA-binding NarL/FixJ family response regulator
MAGSHIIIADEHPLFRDALRQALGEYFGDLTISEAGSLEELSAALETGGQAGLVLLDLAMPGVEGCSGLKPLRAQYPDVAIVAVSAKEDAAAMRRALEFGAAGFIPKSQPIEAIRETVKIALEGGAWTPPTLESTAAADQRTAELMTKLATLTPQQIRVLTMLSEGLLNKQIAYKLSVSEATVKAHVSAILQKLEVDSRTQAVIAVNAIETRDWQKLCGDRLRG